MGVSYFVNPSQFAQHPIYASIVSENPHLGFTSSHEPGSAAYRHDLTKFIRLPPKAEGSETAKPVATKVPSNLAKFERTVERSYINRIQMICRQEVSLDWSRRGGRLGADLYLRDRRFKTVTSGWTGQGASLVQLLSLMTSLHSLTLLSFLGFGADWVKVKEITQEKVSCTLPRSTELVLTSAHAQQLPRCAELEKFGYRVQY
jgi:DnaJ homolog subfamily B member 12